jgi:hypothetical protein
MGWFPRMIANTVRKATRVKMRGMQRFVLSVIVDLLKYGELGKLPS